MSTRQILLHILPVDKGYGEPILGLHLYTWALITFEIVILFCGAASMLNRYAVPLAPTGGWPKKAAMAAMSHASSLSKPCCSRRSTSALVSG